MADMFVARQPVYDRELEVSAYELSFGEEAASSTEWATGRWSLRPRAR